jgi:hypothetical protein
MIALLCFFLALVASLFKSKSRLGAENGALRHQLTCACRKLDPHILVMQSAQNGAAEYATNGLDSTWIRRILVQG